MTIKGLHTYRYADNPEEQRFAEAWEQQNKYGRILEYLLSTHKYNHPVSVTEREESIAATVVQWLGSPVGQAFLFDLGYKKC